MSKRTQSIVFCVGFALAVVASAAFDLKLDRDRQIDAVRVEADASVRLIGELLAVELRGAEGALREIAGAVDPTELAYPAPSPEAYARRSQWLDARRSTVPGATHLGLLDGACTLTHGQHPTAQVGQKLDPAQGCTALQEKPGADPLLATLTGTGSGAGTIVLARRIPGAGETVAGYAVLALEPATLARLLERAPLHDGDAVSILDTRQRLLARRPAPLQRADRTAPDTAIKPAGDASAPGAARASIDGVARVLASRKVEGMPFTVVAERADDTWRPAWYWHMATVLGGALMLIALSIIATREHLKRLALADRVEQLSTNDPQTGLLSQRLFMERAWIEFGRARRHKSTVAVALLDIDALMQINTKFGRTAGDRAVQAVAAACRASLRDSDVIGRTGGDEFAIALTDITPEGARIVAERLGTSIATAEIRADDGAVVPITACIGMAIIDSGDRSLETAIAKAEQLLDDARRDGHGRIRTESLVG